MDRIIYARLETAHFTFEVISSSKTEARKALSRAWMRHQHQTGAGSWSEFEDSVQFREFTRGVVQRDGLSV